MTRQFSMRLAVAGMAALALSQSASAQKAPSCLAHRDDPLTVVVTVDGKVLLGGKETALSDLVSKLQPMVARLDAVDNSVSHGPNVCPEPGARWSAIAPVLKVLTDAGARENRSDPEIAARLR